MKKKFLLSILPLACLFAGLTNGCKKDSTDKANKDYPPENSTPTGIGIRTSFTEEFENFYQLSTKGWEIVDNAPSLKKLGL